MAIVMEFTHPNGCHVIVRDDCYRDLTREEVARRRHEISRAILRVDREIQMERARANAQEGNGGATPPVRVGPSPGDKGGPSLRKNDPRPAKTKRTNR